LASEGAKVLVADLAGKAAEACAEDIRAAGGVADAYELDLADEASIAGMMEAVEAAFGGLDILFNNAAATVIARVDDGGIADMDLQVWNTMMAVNLTGAMIASKLAIPLMKQSGGGAIVNTLSGSASSGSPRQSAYLVSKAGLAQLTRAIATQHGRDGIRCNAVGPGFTVSPDPDRQGAAKLPADQLMKRNLIGRLGQPEDIANAVRFLASDEASFITGQILVVDGGASAHGGDLAPGPT
jgi:NAD(P)-dependent dehydrogenase (short-subunit alcohol dehydrogenase family)